MKILVFGNSDLQEDSIALKIIPNLRRRFPEIQFQIHNSLDEIKPSRSICVLDSAVGISNVTFISDLNQLKKSTSSTLHDFDIAFELQFLKKIGKIQEINIIAIPFNHDKKIAIRQVSEIIKSKLLQGN